MGQFKDLSSDEQAQYRLVVRQMLRLAGSYAIPIIFGDPAWKGRFTSGATGSVVQVASGFFVITASHVLAGYESFAATQSESIWQVGNLGFDPRNRIAARDASSDVVALRVTESEAMGIGGCIASDVRGWPPPAPSEGQHIFTSGYPKALRETAPPGRIGAGPLSMFLRVDSVGSNYFYCQVEREQMIDCNENDPVPGDYDFGGWSGSPILLTESLTYPLVGIVSEYQRTYGLLRGATLNGLGVIR